MNALLTVMAVWLAALVLPSMARAQSEEPGVGVLLQEVQAAFLSGDPSRYVALTSTVADRDRAAEFAAAQVLPGVTRAVAYERDRVELLGDRPGHRLMVEVFTETGDQGRIITCRLDIRDLRPDLDAPGEPDWQIVDQEVLTVIDHLFRLSLNPDKQYAARGLVIEAEDITFRLNEGSMFVSEVPDGATAIVLTGDGEMVFEPLPVAERRQVEIFSGDPVLRERFDAVMIRLNPDEIDRRLTAESLDERSVDPGAFASAQAFFGEQVGNSFGLDLTDLSGDTWSLVPPSGDFLAEIRTRRYGTLTYAHASSEAEDVALFDRENQRNISTYSSVRRLSIRGPFYNEDDRVAYDVEHTDLRVDFDPEREWVEGSASLVVRVESFVLTNLTLRLAGPLSVHRVTSRRFGRLMTLRIREQDQILITLPTTLVRGERFDLTITYGGRLPPEQQLDREALTIAPQYRADFAAFRTEPRYVYSNRSLWYPQSTVTDYGTSRMRLGVPVGLGCVASGTLVDERLIPSSDEAGQITLFEFRSTQPSRYLSAAISRFVPAAERTLVLTEQAEEANIETNLAELGDLETSRGGAFFDTLDVSVVTNPRHRSRGEELADQVVDIMGFYSDVLGDFPYPTLTLALVEHETPGGHSPAYVALLHQPLPQERHTWRNDPVNFTSYPEFFLAHELAHQYFGQAVGWRNYHEQWLSEGLAQYLALLYAEHQSEDRLRQVLQRMRETAIEESPEGPVYLGYRLGHIRGEGSVFRALVYNKGAMVMHMLRRLVGDEAFFHTLRRFYFSARFRKAGTDQLRRLFEEVTGRPLDRFFTRWIYEMEIPTLQFEYEVVPRPAIATAGLDPSVLVPGEADAGLLRVRFEQAGPIFDLPVTVEVEYADGSVQDVVVPVTEEETEMVVPLRGRVRNVKVNDDNAALARIES